MWSIHSLDRVIFLLALRKTVNPTIKVFADNPAVALEFARDFVELLKSLTATQPQVTVSLSGGSTPKLLFEILANQFATDVPWNQVHFFWGDERCVPPEDEQSNFGEANKSFLSKIEIPSENIHRVIGESAPSDERIRYGELISSIVTNDENGVPKFDIMLLGMGGDGHTASIFPHQIELLNTDDICDVATHPESGQQRITITGKVLNASSRVFYLITGAGKSQVLGEILAKTAGHASYPVSHVMPEGRTTFYLDEAAASHLS
ncbi:MAG: 6-phosphogluconolactonase [Mariniblastus sp.]